MSRSVPTFALLAALAAGASCQEARQDAVVAPAPGRDVVATAEPGTPAGASTPAAAAAATAAPEKAHDDPPGLHNFKRWSDHISQGAQPDPETGFASLQALGFKTVLTVDGSRPDVETAKHYGLKYVHVPVGYDGITADEQARIIKAVGDSDGPVYVHCHHGLHRGPAAAAIAREGVEGVSNEEANAGLKETCSPDYTGLYRDVLAFQAPSAATLAALPELPEAIRPAGLRAAMVAVDMHWDLMKACKEAGWDVPADHPDVVPMHEATILKEALREVGRLDEGKAKGDDFLAQLARAETAATKLETVLRGTDTAAATAAFAEVKASCAACHSTYRDKD